MTLNTSSISPVEENAPSKEPSSAQGHTSKLQLSDGSSIYAKLVVSDYFFLPVMLKYSK
jgi:ubiquinone biosynthesis monooxygenase Coq6